ncbi:MULTISPECIES: hypothetical protein [unclassified Burkholderia]|uniref:hypothetical protein n=1 Tax=unclassified Burkholderia TaxID=2613784 RepID=UPI001FC872C0|nr:MULTISPECIES: hypothetical protein [unclassified Burkholderia]
MATAFAAVIVVARLRIFFAIEALLVPIWLGVASIAVLACSGKVLVNLRGAQGIIRLRQKVGDQRLEAPASARSRSAARSTAPSRASSKRASEPVPRPALTRTAAASAVISNPC